MEERIDYFDCHADTLTEIVENRESLWRNKRNLDLERVFGFAKRYTQVFAIWRDRNEMGDKPEAEFAAICQKARRLIDAQRQYIALCQSGADMKNAHAAGKAAAFFSVEDISIMGNMAANIKQFGFTFAMMSWNYENRYATGAVCAQERGLTGEGRRMVKCLLDQNIIMDVSHLSDAGVEDILSMTDKPIIASHSNVRALCDHPRNLRREHICEIIRRGGIIGVNFYQPFMGEGSGLKDLLRHMDYILNLGGEKSVVLGGDFDGCWRS